MPPANQIPELEWEIGMIELAPSVYAYQQPGGWCRSNGGLVVGDDFAILIDTQFTADLNANYVAAIRQVTELPVRFIINTHHHGDHCFGNHLFPQAWTVAHQNCREEIIKRSQPDPAWLAQKFPRYDFGGVRYVLPQITFQDRLKIFQGERCLELLYHDTCHSASDIAVHLPEEKTVFCGDYVFYKNAPLGLDSSFVNWIRALDKLAALRADHYVPGHGPVCGVDGLLEAKGYLELVYREAEKRYRAGMPPGDAALDIDLGQYKDWHCTERILANVARIYREFAGEAPTTAIDTDSLMAEMDRLASRG
jgi:cyclase